MKPTDKPSAINPAPSEETADFLKAAAKLAGDAPALTPFLAALELINPHMYSVEDRIRAQARDFDPAVEGYVSYVSNKGGKRLRPVLALLAGGASGEISSGHVDLAVIVELIHIATLVHDDIMDGADLRRDQPTANAKWGNSLSVLLGDCLFAHALKLAAAYGDPTICRRIAEASSEVCSGEIIQTQRRYDLKLTTAEYYRIIEMKTAALFSIACELSAYINSSSPAVISALKTYGTKLGVAYQVYDDCLDLAGTEEETGKTLGTDIRKGKFTLPILLMLQNGDDTSRELRDMLVEDHQLDEARLAAMVRHSGSVAASAKVAQRLIVEASDALKVLPPSRYVQGLQSITEHLTGLVARML